MGSSYKRIEIIVGIFVVIGIMSMGYLALKVGGIGGFGTPGYTLDATFDNVAGIRVGADVMIAGVSIGRVNSIALHGEDEAKLLMQINQDVNITRDAIATIRTKGIIGDRYVRVSQGGDESYLKDGSSFEETESAINIEDLISKYIFSTEEE
ncbi:MAG: outer membrane lipid asymmetry maintenance protein MlaD [Mariprofundaceae bacterium]